MKTEVLEKLKSNPRLWELVEKREKFSWTMAIVMLIVYYAFILTIAFDPSLLGKPLSEGSITTIGIPIGIGIIVFAFILTGIYVNKANKEFDTITKELKESIKELL
ncbi:hypothetical protein NitYY0826_C0635 [Nitratiruptor sp. YY08-26]|uniref:DUF485 domain-containing protein n=1 Tax=unclassified Nitratiruptor TaxID=2624044 RepID=UPI00191605F1|nr:MULTISPECIES: DUF485 domain-containing protein [unclassified Nitratiruptor]BCD61772.1 hypothetical protein NitYY0813_C0633 [Nitratiruptor sp. YY08-13]BCD65707.1 hypothetical protein NitYY0826_C0635 [Nitratiruptor sp. YY08-26]